MLLTCPSHTNIHLFNDKISPFSCLVDPPCSTTSAPSSKPSSSKPSTKVPTSKPTTAVPSAKPTCAAGPSFTCTAFYDDPTYDYSVITKENAASAAQTVYKKMFVGGNFSNPGTSSITVNGHVYYGDIIEPINTNFNVGKTKLSTMSSPPVNFAYYEWLATHLVAGVYSNGYQVIVATQPKGSCYHMYDFLPADAQGSNNGKTLIVFTFTDTICLTKTPDGRQFGPSVLAPFSNVTLADAGYLDGIIIARRFTTVMNGASGSEQQLHGNVYAG